MKYHYLDDSFWIYGQPTHELLDEVEWNSLFFHWVHTVQNIYMSQTKMSLQYIIRQAQTEPENTTVRTTSQQLTPTDQSKNMSSNIILP